KAMIVGNAKRAKYFFIDFCMFSSPISVFNMMMITECLFIHRSSDGNGIDATGLLLVTQWHRIHPTLFCLFCCPALREHLYNFIPGLVALNVLQQSITELILELLARERRERPRNRGHILLHPGHHFFG